MKPDILNAVESCARPKLWILAREKTLIRRVAKRIGMRDFALIVFISITIGLFY